MKVELPVSGIRYYCGGEEHYPELFARLPIGSDVVLRRNRTGDDFSYAIYVYDMEMNTIGAVPSESRCFIELDVPEDGVLYAKVTGHSVEDNCMYVEAENTKGFSEPYIREITPESNEIVFSTTKQDIRMEQLTDMVKTQLERYENQDMTEQEINSFLKVFTNYSKLCCISIDGGSKFKRGRIQQIMRNLSLKHPELKQAYSDFFEQFKDIRKHEVYTEVYRQQYENIFASATAKGKNGKSQVDQWIDVLKFTNGGTLPKSVIQEEMNRLAKLLAKELMNTYIKCIDSDEDFARALYLLKYSLRSIYVLYTRRIKYNYLKKMLDGDGESAEDRVEDALFTQKAVKLWEKLRAAGYVDEHYKPIVTSMNSQNKFAVIAAVMGDFLKLKPLWKRFEKFWEMKNMANKFSQAKADKYYSGFHRDIVRLLNK